MKRQAGSINFTIWFYICATREEAEELRRESLNPMCRRSRCRLTKWLRKQCRAEAQWSRTPRWTWAESRVAKRRLIIRVNNGRYNRNRGTNSSRWLPRAMKDLSRQFWCTKRELSKRTQRRGRMPMKQICSTLRRETRATCSMSSMHTDGSRRGVN